MTSIKLKTENPQCIQPQQPVSLYAHYILLFFSSQDLYLDLYTCMEYVLGHTKVTRWEMFQDIFHTATSMLACPTDQSKGIKQSIWMYLGLILKTFFLLEPYLCSGELSY